MLTLILLVVLGGGVGLLAVSLAEKPKPATNDAAGPRAGAPDEPSPSDPTPAPEPEPFMPVRTPEPTPPRGQPAIPAVGTPLPLVATGRPAVADRPDPRFERADALPRRIDRGRVPKAYTAVEGRYQDVIRPPIWRRLVSLGLIAVIVVVVGVSIAAILGAIIGAVAEVLGNTIG